MSTCDITSGFTLGCRDNSGGIKNLYILSGSIIASTDASEGLIETISGSGEFFQFELFSQTSDFSEAIRFYSREWYRILRTKLKCNIL